jgi:hypothetical protein
MNPPGSACGHEWQTTTSATASARRAWISGLICFRPTASQPIAGADV